MEKNQFTLNQWVLGKQRLDDKWDLAHFAYYDNDAPANNYRMIGGGAFHYCIPFKGNEHLLGTTDDYVEPYVPKDGDFVAMGSKNTDDRRVWLCIFKSTDPYDQKLYFHFGLASDNQILENEKQNCYVYNESADYIRPATKDEKQLILSKLKKIGKSWNDTEKRVQDIWTPKDGDFVVIEEANEHTGSINKWICIFLSLSNVSINFHVGSSLRGDLINKGYPGNYKRSHKEHFRLATGSEIQQLLSRLAEIGKQWNAEKKCIEDIYQPKDGDFVNRYDKEVLICKRPKKDKDGGYAFHIYASLTLDDNYLHTYGEYAMQLKLRPATDSEKQQLLDALHKGGKDWDESKKKIVEYKWKPNTNDKYYYVNSALIVDSDCWTSDLLDEQRYRISNCFRTHEEAQAMADKFKKLLKGGKE